MDNGAEVREFLTSRRARVSPRDVGLAAGTNRRVDGFRRSEVTAWPAFVRNGRMDLLATNALGRAFCKDAFDVPGLTLTIYAAEPRSDSAERMQLLASWAASEAQDASAVAADEQRSKHRG